jgi:uncharacterized protein (TIGR03118 family)
MRPSSGQARVRWLGVLLALLALAVFVPAAVAMAHGHGHRGYVQTNLVSDIKGMARVTDPNLVNPWGMAAGPATPIWISDNGTDVSTLYSGGVRGSTPVVVPLVVTIPDGAPTGIVFNPTTGFVVDAGSGSAPANFIFSSEAGKITAWSKTVSGTQAQVEASSPTAIYKGLALASSGGATYLYATNFHDGAIDVFDSSFKPVTLYGAFTDPKMPAGYAPFGIQLLAGKLYVTYARQDAAGEDDVAGRGKGFVDIYSLDGQFVKRLISRGDLNAPWGLALAPHEFGRFSNALLVGNFGDGTIHAYNPNTGALRGQLMNQHGKPIVIDGLWGLQFGNGVTGTSKTLLFTAGPANESHGLFGEITAHH